MRKYILIIILISISAFSQEKSFEKISQFDIQLKWNRAQIRLDQTIGNIKYPFRFEAIARFKRANVSVGMLFPLSNKTFIALNIGQEYHYVNKERNSILGASFRSEFDYGLVRIDYGSHWISNHGVSTTVLGNVVGPFIRTGIATNNEYIGPHTEWGLRLGSRRKKQIRFHVTYFPKGDNWDYGLRLRFQDWFPKLDKKMKEHGEKLNPFN